MPKNRKKTYGDHQSDAARLKKQQPKPIAKKDATRDDPDKVAAQVPNRTTSNKDV